MRRFKFAWDMRSRTNHASAQNLELMSYDVNTIDIK